jgi:regulator of replication initiation timing
MEFTTIAPVLTAVVAGIAGIIGGPMLAGWFARRQQKADTARKMERDNSAAKLTTDQAERALLSANVWKFVGELQSQIELLTKSQAEMRTQLDSLGDELATVRRANTALRLENDELKERLAGETTRHDILKRRVDGLDAANLVLRDELHRHGIAVPALAQPEPTP